MLIISEMEGEPLGEKILKKLKENILGEEYRLGKDEGKNCIGCFRCWLKSQGRCFQGDEIDEIVWRIKDEDWVLLVTPIRYGGYSATMKKLLDRSIPNIMPFFREFQGRIHHQMRYEKNPRIITLGYGENLSPREKKCFSLLVEANGENRGSIGDKPYIIESEAEIEEIIKELKGVICV